jgi:hypothetical protein
MRPGSDVPIEVYRDITRHWANTDGTQQESPEDTALRFTVFPRWSNNSCAVDSALFVGIMLNAGRSIIDTISTVSLTPEQRLHPSSTFRTIMCTPWGTITPDQRDALRDRLAMRLEKYNKTLFPCGSLLAVTEVLETCFNSFANVSFTTIVEGVRICCDNVNHYPERVHYTDITMLNLTGPDESSFQQLLHSYFDAHPLNDTSTCSNGANCTREWRRRLVIVDESGRVPPTLLVSFARPISPGQAKKMSVFDRDITIRAQFLHYEDEISYIVVGCVYRVNGIHFIGRWRVSASEWVEYDGMGYNHRFGKPQDDRGGLVNVKDFLDGLHESSTSIAAVVLRLDGLDPEWGGKSIRRV